MINKIYVPENSQHDNMIHHTHSFICRRGRLTKGQRNALAKYWPAMGIEYQSTTVNIDTLFVRHAPIVLEIGFGMGSSLVTMASNNPQKNFLGVEVYLPGVGSCLAHAHEAKLSNIRVICHDAVETLQTMIQDNALNIVQLFFPDPWQKKRHNKRRIVQSYFVELVLRKLKVGGLFHMATDWHPYAEHMLKVMKEVIGYRNLSNENNYLLRQHTRPLTKFELRAQSLGHDIWDLMFEKINNSS